jgi:hypothetical protein
MQSLAALSDFADCLQRIIQARPTLLPDHQFAGLALKLFELQRELNEPYRKLCTARGSSQQPALRDWKDIPAVPTSAFKDLELSCLAPNDRTTVFHSSGTTQHRPSRHFHNSESLSVYEASLIAALSQRLDASNRLTVISLTPSRESAPNSSLIYMFESFREKLGDDSSTFVGKIERDGGWTLDGEVARKALQRTAEFGKPALILGTAFLYVHLLDYLNKNDISFKLPPGSHVLETGGYKGRSRIIPKDELHQLICERLGITPANIICEYGMSELSSQAYDNNPEGIASFSPRLRGTSYPGFEASKLNNPERVASNSSSSTVDAHGIRFFHFPSWVRVHIISPETGREVNEGETGLIRIFDLANVFSVMAIQTEDLGVRHGIDFELIGRAAVAEPRGCSLMAV